MDLSWRPVALAVELVVRGADFVVVGSTARRLLTGQGSPRDLDVVVRRPEGLRSVLECLGLRLAGGSPQSVATFLGRLDVFVGSVPGALAVPVGGVVLRVGPT